MFFDRFGKDNKMMNLAECLNVMDKNVHKLVYKLAHPIVIGVRQNRLHSIQDNRPMSSM